jgi:hypothetical protein
MASIYKIKTTAVNNFFGFPELFLYVNQELFDTYVDQPTGTIFEETYSGIPNNKIINEVLKDDASVYRLRKIYYNNFIEKQYESLAPLTDIFNLFGRIIYKYDANTYQTSLLYNNLNYGDLTCFTPTMPTGTPTVNDTMIMGGQNNEVPYFGGYYINAGIAPRASNAFINIPVFSEDILNEDEEIEIQGKYILIQISCSDQLPQYGSFRLSIRFVAQGNVSTLTNASMFSGTTVSEDTADPYEPEGTVDQGGGDGTYDGTSDTISEPGLPTLSAIDTGFVTIFKPTKTQLKSLYDYLWTGVFDIENFRKIFANPIDTIMGFGIVPINLVTDIAKEVKVGNIATGVYMDVVSEQYYRLDCGTITIPEYWGTYLDYEPYFTMDLYLPYIGSVHISTDDIKRNWIKPKTGTIQVVYHIDILSGACVAYILCNGSVAYEYAGSCLTQLPITGNDFTSTFQSIIGIAGNVASAGIKAAAGGAAGILNDATNAAHNVMNAKPTVNRSGGVASTSGLMGVQTPYLILNRPIPAVATNQNKYTGYPAHMTKIVSEVHGYAEWEQVWFKDIPATDPELQELKTLLDGGVIL